MKKTLQTQQELLRAARDRLKISNAELAKRLGKKSEAGLLAWLAPETSGKHRTMPEGARLLLAAILKEHRSAKKK